MAEVNYSVTDEALLADAVVYTFIAMLAVQVWDLLVSFEKEYHRVWTRRWSPIAFLYLASRYYSIGAVSYASWMFNVQTHSWAFCERAWRSSVYVCLFIETFSGGILLVRTWAVCNKSRPILALLLFGLATVTGLMIAVAQTSVMLLPWLDPTQTRGRCVAIGDNSKHHRFVLAYWLGPFCYNALLTGITIFQCIRIRSQHPARTPLLRVFLQNGIFYFVITTITSLLNLAFFLQPNVYLEGAALAFQFGLSSIFSCRLVLTLRDPKAMAIETIGPSKTSGWVSNPFSRRTVQPEADDACPSLTNTESQGTTTKYASSGEGDKEMTARPPIDGAV